jgi:hypothetical protein
MFLPPLLERVITAPYYFGLVSRSRWMHAVVNRGCKVIPSKREGRNNYFIPGGNAPSLPPKLAL